MRVSARHIYYVSVSGKTNTHINSQSDMKYIWLLERFLIDPMYELAFALYYLVSLVRRWGSPLKSFVWIKCLILLLNYTELIVCVQSHMLTTHSNTYTCRAVGTRASSFIQAGYRSPTRLNTCVGYTTGPTILLRKCACNTDLNYFLKHYLPIILVCIHSKCLYAREWTRVRGVRVSGCCECVM